VTKLPDAVILPGEPAVEIELTPDITGAGLTAVATIPVET
jgi:hypothetical protein